MTTVLTNNAIQQSGTVTPGHAVGWVTDGVVKDAGAITTILPNNAVLQSGTVTVGHNPAFSAAYTLVDGGPVVNIAALRARSVAAPAQIYVEGYYAIGDGGGGIFAYVASDTTSADNGGTIIVDLFHNRWYRDTGGRPVTALQFGAKFDGTTDDTTALQAAITWQGGLGGGYVDLPPRAAVISSTISITTQNTGIRGQALGGWHDTTPAVTGGTRLIWAGSSGGTMVQVQPAGGATEVLYGCGVENVFLDSGSACAIGLSVMSHRQGLFRVSGQEFSTTIINVGVSSSLSEAADTQRNTFDIYGKQITNSSPIMILDGSATADTSLNTISVTGDYKNGTGLLLKNCDSNTFPVVQLSRAAGGSGNGIVLSAASTIDVARYNLFLVCAAGLGGIYAQGTETNTYPSTGNQVYSYDKSDSDPTPLVGPSAVLSWTSNQAPIGYQSYTQSANVAGSSSLLSVDSNAHVRMTGLTNTVAGSGTATVTLPLTLPSGTTVVHVTPQTAPGTFSATCTLTTLTITNGATANKFYWTVEGL
jgi:hypothetical protein